ncbi:MAG: hypothetical protein WCO42_01785 [bacterium]
MIIVEMINNWLVLAMDYVFGWVLYLPRDLALFSVAAMTSFVMVITRKWASDQGWLKRANDDTIRLNQLTAVAKKENNIEAVKRYQQTQAQIKMKSMKQEGAPLLWALLPIILLATWCFGRIAFLPPKADEWVTVKAYFGTATIGNVVHLVPSDGLKVKEGWVRPVKEDMPVPATTWWEKGDEWLQRKMGSVAQLGGAAVWTVSAQASDKPYDLQFVLNGQVYKAPLLVGQKRYEQQWVILGPDSGIQAIEFGLAPLKLFGFIPGIRAFGLAPWLIGYLVIVIPFALIIKRVLHIY